MQTFQSIDPPRNDLINMYVGLYNSRVIELVAKECGWPQSKKKTNDQTPSFDR